MLALDSGSGLLALWCDVAAQGKRRSTVDAKHGGLWWSVLRPSVGRGLLLNARESSRPP